MPDHYLIPKEKIVEGIKISLENSRDLITEAITLTEHFSVSFHVLGMYTFAIEEFGKALILEDCMNQTGDNSKVAKSIFFGKQAHSEKFKKALDVLPHDCKYVYNETETFVNSSNQKKTVTSKDGSKHELGGGHALVLSEPLLTDFETRLNCFYLGWNPQKNDWRKNPSPEFTNLEKTLKAFRQIIIQKLENIDDH